MEQHQKQNPAHSSGSPGFLRGRGRGRPKLIGDELDAELVDYMVQVCIALTLWNVVFVLCTRSLVFLNLLLF